MLLNSLLEVSVVLPDIPSAAREPYDPPKNYWLRSLHKMDLMRSSEEAWENVS